MNAFLPQLLSLSLPHNYVEAGDTVPITLTWQNIGTEPYRGNARIAIDFVFDRTQRHNENQTDLFRTVWTPFPNLSDWLPGQTVTTTGTWKVPETWCGSFFLHVSLLSENGEAIPFFGKGDAPVFSEELTDIDLGWGWGHVMLVAQRRPIHEVYHTPKPIPSAPLPTEAITLGAWHLDPAVPALIGYGSIRYEATLPFFKVRHRADARVCRLWDEVSYTCRREENSLRYTARGTFGSVDLLFTQKEKSLLLTAENVVNTETSELVSITFPRLLRFEEDGTLLNFFAGGREVSIAASAPMCATFRYDTCLAVAGYDGNASLAVVSEDMESLLFQAVEQINGSKRGVVGCELMLLVPSVTNEVPSIPVPPMPIELHPLSAPSWQALATFMRDRLPQGKPDFYRDTLFYKISADKTLEMDEARPITYSTPLSFAEIRRIIERVYHFSGGMRQVVYLVGWQRNGHDTEYPVPYRYGFSPRLGPNEWEETLAFAKAHNTILSFHDNFDDVYQFEDIDTDWIATDSRGRKKKGWLWAGGMSYLLSPKAYNLSGEMAHRVKQTVETYHIEDSYHLDVLSAEVRRYDFAPKTLSGARENVEYKKKIVEEFNRYGIDITSELLSAPFVGSIGYALHTRYNFSDTLFSAERLIPLTTMIYHGRIRYNMGSLSETERLRAVALGASCGLDCLGLAFETEHLRSLYLHAMPMQFLATKEVSDCESDATHITVHYGDNSFVSVNFEDKTETIVADGKILLENGVAILSAFDGSNDLLLYATEETTVTLPFDSIAARVCRLGADGETLIGTATAAEGKLTLHLDADTPIRLSAL